MECIVRKLKAVVDNANLPEFENVVLKNYITTTQDEQYIQLSGIYYTYNNVKMEVTFEDTLGSGNRPVCGVMPGIYVQRNNGYVRIVNQSEGALSSVPINTECNAGFDSSDGSFFINGTTGTCSNPASESYRVNQAMVFATPNRLNLSKAGAIKIKQVKLTDTTNNLVYTLVPAEVNGVAVLYDQDRGTYYGEINGGTLVCG